jgi:hypothetical protein
MGKTFRLKNIIALILVVLSGAVVLLLSDWNSRQAETLLQWTADREGQILFNELIHESALSPGRIYQQPELLEEMVLHEESLISAGILRGSDIIASFTSEGFVLKPVIFSDRDSSSRIINQKLAVYRKESGAGHAGRKMRYRQGRNFTEKAIGRDRENMSIYLVFTGPDHSVIKPLEYQKILWPVVWFFLSLLWGGLLYNQQKMAQLREVVQKESNLASIGKMSARLAHEIKNPLGAIRGTAQLLEKKLETEKELQAKCRTIEKETFRLEELARSILDYSKPIELKPVSLSLNAVITDNINLFKGQNPDCIIDIEVQDTGLQCVCDENALRQILTNLLQNAFDACPKECKISLRVIEVHGRVFVKICNPGQIEKEDMPKIFEPFYSTKVRGYGLGLSISKKLAEGMNGSLTIENQSDNMVAAILILPGDEK